jgi:hypothetical protein
MDAYSFEIAETIDASWNEKLLSGKTESLYLYHATPWADRLKELLGFRPFYFLIKQGNEIRLMLLACVEPLPKISLSDDVKNTIRNLLKRLKGKKSLSWSGQPIFFKDNDEGAYAFLAARIQDLLKNKSLRLSRGEWPISQKSALPKNWVIKEWATLKVDLTQDLQDIYASFKPAARKEVRKAKERGVTVKRLETIEELRVYYEFAEQCAKRYNKHLIGFRDFSTMWNHFRRWGFFETFVAYYSGRMIGGLSVWGDRNCVIEIGSFQSEECFRQKLGSADIIKWEVIQWAKSVRARSFDLAGINPFPQNEKEQGIRRFKEKWSSQEYRFLIVAS